MNMPPRSTSVWFDASPDERRYPALSGMVRAEYVVVGAGIVGVMTAWRLAVAGRRVVLLEKNHVGTGDTGFTTAFLTRVPDTSAASLAKRYGKEFVRKVFAATTAAQEYARELIASEHIDCDFQDCTSFNYAYRLNDETLAAEWEVVKDADPQAQFLVDPVAGEDPKMLIAEALVFKREARFHVRKFLFGLLAKAVAKRIQVFEESEVTDFSVGRFGVTVKTARGTVKAKKAIFMTGLPIGAFSELRSVVEPRITFALAASYTSGAPISDNLFWDTDSPYQYYRLFDHRTASIVLGGEDRGAAEKVDSADAKPHEKLQQFLQKRASGQYTITHQWSGSLFETEDGLPCIDQHPHYGGKVIVATGFGGNGMVIGGMLGSWIAADLAMGQANAHAPLFSFRRTGVKIAKPSPRKSPFTIAQRALRWILPIVFLALLPLPAYVFFTARNGLAFLQGTDFQTANLLLFPLLGLYAFFFVWAQIIIGSSINPLRRVFPGIEKFHRIEGVVAFLFAVTHPSMLFLGVGPAAYLAYEFVDPAKKFFVFLAQFALLLMFCTVGTALLRKTRMFQKIWRKIHYANYAVFVLVWTHSWNIGSDVQSTNLRYLWYFFGITAVLSTAWRIWRAYHPAQLARPAGARSFVKVATADQLKEGALTCVEAKGQKIVLLKIGETISAIDNTCSHAGGPLCDGALSGTVVECPWHGSKFDVTTGAVVGGPARSPQTAYKVRITGNDVEVEV